MKLLTFLLPFYFCMLSAHAEVRVIGIKVDWAPNPKSGVFEGGKNASVSIFSEVKEENQHNIPIDRAAEILSRAEGWGSTVDVYILTRAELRDYLPLLVAISKNGWLKLQAVTTTIDKSNAELFTRVFNIKPVSK